MIKKLIFKKLNGDVSVFQCLNDIHDVIDGKPPGNEQDLWINANQYAYGLGNGAVDSVRALGESILVNGIAYTKPTDQAAMNYYKLVEGEKFMTTWMFMVSKDQLPVYEVSDNTEDINETVADIYASIYEKIQKPFVVAGVMEFVHMKGAAIAKPPIENQNIFEYKEEYYPYKADLKNVSAAIVGVATKVEEITDEKLKKAIKKVVYYNPLESKSDTLTTHEHVLILNKTVLTIDEVRKQDATDVQHLFTDSIVKRCCLKVYAIGAIQ